MIDELAGLTFMVHLHRRVFGGVRGHAGRHRSRYFGSDRLVFGGHRSSARETVEEEVDLVFRRLRRQLSAILDAPNSPNYEYDSILLAATIHADLVRIHPFQDGNGRTSRLIMDWVLVRLGLRPIPVEACKDEYYLVMNHYMVHRDPGPLVDLYLRLYTTT
jgi:Fic family protein